MAPSDFNLGPRIAKSNNGGPIEKNRIPKMNNPLVGSDAKLWTDVKVRAYNKSARRDNENPVIAIKLSSFSAVPAFQLRLQNAVRRLLQAGHQRCIFNEVPEPPSPPSKLAICPPTSKAYAES